MIEIKKNLPEIAFSRSANKADTAVILVYDDRKLSKSVHALDKTLGGLLSHQIEISSKFEGENGKNLTVTLPRDSEFHRIILLGLGPKSKMNMQTLETAGGNLAGILRNTGCAAVSILNADDFKTKSSDPVMGLLDGLLMGSYSFDDYKTIDKDKKTAPAQTVTVITSAVKTMEKEFTARKNLVDSVFLARDLVNCPPNKLYPETFAAHIKKILTPLGVKIKILDEKEMEKSGMGCIIAVGKAAQHQPRLVIMSWDGKTEKNAKPRKPLALVGKGITFDSGGLNVKPYEGMMDMKMDMGGAAAVVGAMHAIAARKCKTPVIGIVALAENAISDTATRPSDIITSYSGKTVEILNTDAEGRLVLADALTYVQQKYDPAFVIDLATLTGAIMIALGTNHCGVFANDEKLWKNLEKSASLTGEKVWRMPLDNSFRKEMDSNFADIRNIGGSRNGGSCTAAAFLGEFIDKDRPWAHLDIAGVAMSKTTSTCPVPFASGYGVRLLDRLIGDFYE